MEKWIFLLILITVGLAVMNGYNKLVALKNRFKNALSQIDVQLQRRYDLIPNLVETAKGYMAHERETLEAVISARNQALAAANLFKDSAGAGTTTKNLAVAETALGGAMSRIYAVMETNPDIKANENKLALQEELSSTENRVAFARQAFNDSVMLFNVGCDIFPNNLYAGIFGFKPVDLWALEDSTAKKAVHVNF